MLRHTYMYYVFTKKFQSIFYNDKKKQSSYIANVLDTYSMLGNWEPG